LSDKLPAITSKQLIRALERGGWQVDRVRGSHYVLIHPGRRRPVTVPMHNKDLKTGTLNAILKEADISRDELRKLL
jgi:predicted RNA binding protein YcfA (HicA-like mRNA interferase family)